MGCDFIGDDPRFDIFFIREAKVFLWCDIAQHRAPVPPDHGCPNPRGNVVVPRSDISRQGAQCVERRFLASLQLLFHVDLDEMHRDMAWPFDHDLDIVLPGNVGQFPQSVQLGELSVVVCVGDGTRSETVP